MKKEDIDIKNKDIPEERLKKYYKEFKVSTLMDDMKFHMICKLKEVIREI